MIRPNRYDYLKVFALLTMIVDHIGYFLYPELIRLRVIGRISFPLFLLLVGYNASYRFSLSLWSIAWLVQGGMYIAFFMGYIPLPVGNILLAIVLTRVILSRVTNQSFFLQRMVFIISIIVLPYSYSIIDYGTLSISFGLIGWRMRTTSTPTYTSGGTITIIWAITIVIYMIFMVYTSNFGPHTYWALLGMSLILFFCGMWLYRGNTPLLLSKITDTSILRLSNHTLSLYLIHAVLIRLIATRGG